MLVDPDLALGTLQTLARFQGTQVDPITEEEPGRILHEMRFGEAASLALGGGRVYYGTADATPLFVMLLGEVSRWGSRRDEVDALLPAADRALAWIEEYGDKDGDGYVEYARTSDRGLQNQGWKDSWDSMRFIDGSLAQPPIALCEVQGYVYAALIARSHIATEFGDVELAQSLRGARRRAEAPLQRGLLGRDRRRRLLRDGPRPRQAERSTASARTWATACGPASSPRTRRRPSRARCTDPAMLERLGHPHAVGSRAGLQPALVPLRQRLAARQRDLRRRSHALRLRRGSAPRDARASSRRRRGSATCSRSCSPACRAARSASRCPIRRRARRRRGRPRRRCCSSARCCASSPTSGTRSCTSRPAVPPWIGRLRLERVPVMGGHLTLDVEGDVVHAAESPRGPGVGVRAARGDVLSHAPDRATLVDHGAERAVHAVGREHAEVALAVEHADPAVVAQQACSRARARACRAGRPRRRRAPADRRPCPRLRRPSRARGRGARLPRRRPGRTRAGAREQARERARAGDRARPCAGGRADSSRSS